MSKLESKAWAVVDTINEEITNLVKSGMTGKRLTMMTLKGEAVFTCPLTIRPPDRRVWVRGDGSRYKDPGYIKTSTRAIRRYGRRYSTFRTMFRNDEQAVLDYVWEALQNTKGAKDLGTLSGSFRSDEHRPAMSVNGMLWVKRRWGIEFGSMSRLKSKYGVWNLTPPKE